MSTEVHNYLSQVGVPGVKHRGPEPGIERYLKKDRSTWLIVVAVVLAHS